MRSARVVRASVELSKIARTPHHTLWPNALVLFSTIVSLEKPGEALRTLLLQQYLRRTAKGGNPKSQAPNPKQSPRTKNQRFQRSLNARDSCVGNLRFEFVGIWNLGFGCSRIGGFRFEANSTTQCLPVPDDLA